MARHDSGPRSDRARRAAPPYRMDAGGRRRADGARRGAGYPELPAADVGMEPGVRGRGGLYLVRRIYRAARAGDALAGLGMGAALRVAGAAGEMSRLAGFADVRRVPCLERTDGADL